ncbi:hypothetical protein DMC01_10470 [Campylobacter troglodytis]|nr:hypothetical protein DMC01_10470 [Campylobacter troglodytis]
MKATLSKSVNFVILDTAKHFKARFFLENKAYLEKVFLTKQGFLRAFVGKMTSLINQSIFTKKH